MEEKKRIENTEEDALLKFDFPTDLPSIIKVIGVGGGGGNAVAHMFRESRIRDVSFVICNTDKQALKENEVPIKLQLGAKGLGAGGNPELARIAAEESIDDLKLMLSDGTEMAFITAGMGGGTGTGAAPVVARVAKEIDILTVGIVTIPFMFEGVKKILQALKGVEELKKNVDAMLVINNERLRDIYSDLDVPNAFRKADDILAIAAKSISEIITIPGYINLDFADVNTILKDGGVAIMSSGLGKGTNRVSTAIDDALHSPLLNNNDIFKAKKILLNITFGGIEPLMMEEMTEVHNFMAKFDSDIEVIWGTALDESLEDNVKITILATGFGIENIIPLKELSEEQDKLDKEEEAKQKEREDKRKAEEEIRRIEEAKLLEKYYGEDFMRKIGQTSRPKPFIFTINDMDDNETIEAVINYPAYNRSPRLMLDIAKKAEARRTAVSSEE
ncbi:MAG: cell division protein FtsZ [Tannerella sp.]|jgi:cell division protein FtsZ|nr:cell division protein FtsZ [Tannerella sp.]